MQDRLTEIFETQIRINKNLLNLTEEEKQEYTKQFVIAAITELTEVLEEINWNRWKQKKKVIWTNVWEEIIDAQKYILNISLSSGMNEEKFLEEFRRKSIVVEQRFLQMKSLDNIKEKNLKVIAIDLDGVISEYPSYWIEFVNKAKNTNFKTLFDIKKNLNNEEYFALKHEYRQSGCKEFIPIKKGAKEFIDFLKNFLGYSVVILTKRPYKKYSRLFADTKKNLDMNNIIYDALIFDSEKHKKIIDELPHLDYMIEDDLNIANEVGSWGYKCFLIDNIYNQGEINKNVIRVNDLEQIKRTICKQSTKEISLKK